MKPSPTTGACGGVWFAGFDTLNATTPVAVTTKSHGCTAAADLAAICAPTLNCDALSLYGAEAPHVRAFCSHAAALHAEGRHTS